MERNPGVDQPGALKLDETPLRDRWCPGMRIQTILNRVEKFKSFDYGNAHLEEADDGPALVVQVKPRKNSRPFCSGCGRPGSAYDRLQERRFEFVPLWGIVVFLASYLRDTRQVLVTGARRILGVTLPPLKVLLAGRL